MSRTAIGMGTRTFEDDSFKDFYRTSKDGLDADKDVRGRQGSEKS